MDFETLFTLYKLKKDNYTVPFDYKKMPQYRQVFVCLCIVYIIVMILLMVKGYNINALVPIFVMLIVWRYCIGYENKSKNQQYLYDEDDFPRSERRMKLIVNVLNESKVDWHDNNKLNWLLEEARKKQKEDNILYPLSKWYAQIVMGLLSLIIS